MRVISNALLTLSLWSESLHSLWSYERYLSSILHGATDVTNAICCKMKAARVARTRRAKAFMRPPDCGRDSTIRTFICISPAMARKAPCIMCAHEKSFFSLSHFTPTRLRHFPIGLVLGLALQAPATLEFWVRFPNERNQGKQAHPVIKYLVPHGSHTFRDICGA